MEELKTDAILLAEAHRANCSKADCTTACPEASPLYWAKALLGDRKPRKSTTKSLARTLSGAARALETQAQVIDDAQNLIAEFDGNPEDVPEFLAALREVLSRDV